MVDALENNYPTLYSQLCSTNDSKEVKKILQSNIFMFDASNSGKNGLGSKDIISMFDTSHPSPRRTSMSVTFHPPKHMPSIDCMVQRLFTYGSGGARKAIIDTRSRSMPSDVAQLGEECWKYVRCMLMPMTKLCPPNHCQVCLYNSKFQSLMGLHRDNGYRTSNGKLAGTTVNESSNSHIFGTEVMIVTLGDSMEFNIVPPPTNSISSLSINDYWQNRGKKLTTVLENQSIYIHTANDDEYFMHYLKFPTTKVRHTNNRVRFAFIYRWLSKTYPFRTMDLNISQTTPLTKHTLFHIDAFEQLSSKEKYKVTGKQWLLLNGYNLQEINNLSKYFEIDLR